MASILELPIEEVPLLATGDDWWKRIVEWCDANRIDIDWSPPRDDGLVPIGYAIMSGRSPRCDLYHSVVAYNGELVHDPHTGDRRGVRTLLDWIVIRWRA